MVAENTAKLCQGKYLAVSLHDALHPAKEDKELIDDPLGTAIKRLNKLGIKVVGK